jgi:hypothetical protein
MELFLYGVALSVKKIIFSEENLERKSGLDSAFGDLDEGWYRSKR